MYTSLYYVPSTFSFHLVDELGMLEVYSTFRECIVGSVQLIRVSQLQYEKIVISHQNPALGLAMSYQTANRFLVQLSAYTVSHTRITMNKP